MDLRCQSLTCANNVTCSLNHSSYCLFVETCTFSLSLLDCLSFHRSNSPISPCTTTSSSSSLLSRLFSFFLFSTHHAVTFELGYLALLLLLSLFSIFLLTTHRHSSLFLSFFPLFSPSFFSPSDYTASSSSSETLVGKVNEMKSNHVNSSHSNDLISDDASEYFTRNNHFHTQENGETKIRKHFVNDLNTSLSDTSTKAATLLESVNQVNFFFPKQVA